MCVCQLSDDRMEKNVPLGLREYAALTETVDIEADWIN
jgi:hypothetical protein